MHLPIILLALGSSISFAAAKPRPLLPVGASQVDGVATFNNYNTQTSTVCGKFYADNKAYFGAAIGDISKDIKGGQCDGTSLTNQNYDMTKCDKPQGSSQPGPSCTAAGSTTCGLCFKVDNYGDIAQPPVPNSLGTVTVQVIDACPAGSAMNYCKTDTPANQRCGDGSTNCLDIDETAYQQLTGMGYNETTHPNLNIKITAVSC